MSEKFDKRTVERKIQTGQLTRDEYNEYLASLPDDAENAEVRCSCEHFWKRDCCNPRSLGKPKHTCGGILRISL